MMDGKLLIKYLNRFLLIIFSNNIPYFYRQYFQSESIIKKKIIPI